MAWQDKYVPYIVIVLVLILVPISAYYYFNMFRLHTQRIELNCTEGSPNFAVTSLEELSALNEFTLGQMTYAEKKAFLSHAVELEKCVTGYLYSGEGDQSLKVKIIDKYSNSAKTLYVLPESVSHISR